MQHLILSPGIAGQAIPDFRLITRPYHEQGVARANDRPAENHETGTLE
jgi:hypothetical protein